MTTPRTPRLALALLEWCDPGSSPLAGDLMEEFQRGRSRLWLWWQVLAALRLAVSKQPDEIRPLRLVELQPNDAQERSRLLIRRFDAVNLTASPVHGVGGLGLLVLVLLASRVAPTFWWFLLASMCAGAAWGTAMIVVHRRKLG